MSLAWRCSGKLPAISLPQSGPALGKPVEGLIKYDSHKNADIASFLCGDNKRGVGTQNGIRAVRVLYLRKQTNRLYALE